MITILFHRHGYARLSTRSILSLCLLLRHNHGMKAVRQLSGIATASNHAVRTQAWLLALRSGKGTRHLYTSSVPCHQKLRNHVVHVICANLAPADQTQRRRRLRRHLAGEELRDHGTNWKRTHRDRGDRHCKWQDLLQQQFGGDKSTTPLPE